MNMQQWRDATLDAIVNAYEPLMVVVARIASYTHATSSQSAANKKTGIPAITATTWDHDFKHPYVYLLLFL